MIFPPEFSLRSNDDAPSTELRVGAVLAAVLSAALFWSTALCELAAGGLVFVACLHLIRTGGKGIVLRGRFPVRLVWAALVFCGIYAAGNILSIILSPFPARFATYAHVWHVLLLPALVILSFRGSVVRVMGGIFALSGSLASVVAIIGYLTGSSPHLNALFLGNTTFADLVVLAAILLVGSTMVPASLRILPWKGWQLFLVAIPMILAAFLSALRTPVAVLVVSLAALTLLHRPRAVVLQAAALGVLIVISPLELWLKFAWLAEGHTVDRYVVWRAGLDLIPRLPLFGFGAESYARLLPASAWEAFANRPPASWHNDFLAILLGSGWHTVIAYAAGVGLLAVCGLASWVVRRPSEHAAVAGTLACLVCTLLFFSVFNSVVSTTVLGIAFWAILGLLASTIAEMYRDPTRLFPS